MISNFEYLGNKELIQRKKIAFLCSQKCPANIVLKSYDWAINQRENNHCIVSGFHSKIEKDVFHFLLKGKQPIILVLARSLKKHYNPEIEEALSINRLLIISPFKSTVKRITSETAIKRNEYMCEIADEILVAYASPKGKIFPLVKKTKSRGKKIFSFNVHENTHLFEIGVNHL
jgi:predicted Rossmann fold nucleotide-binding protein DprA/Smf involved in DNA uptake